MLFPKGIALKPWATWIEWRLSTKDGRYFWGCEYVGGGVLHFIDKKDRQWDYKTPGKAQMSKAQAVSMARDYLTALGLRTCARINSDLSSEGACSSTPAIRGA